MKKTRFLAELNREELQYFANVMNEEQNKVGSKINTDGNITMATGDDGEVYIIETEIEEVKPATGNTEEVQIIQETANVPFAIIENVPTYPGCSGSNTEKRKCMQENIQRFVGENFDTSIASKADLSGKQKINTMFKIDQNGDVIGIITKAESPALQAEAARVIKLLPKMQPGKQRGENVGVIYSLPIIFEVSK